MRRLWWLRIERDGPERPWRRPARPPGPARSAWPGRHAGERRQAGLATAAAGAVVVAILALRLPLPPSVQPASAQVQTLAPSAAVAIARGVALLRAGFAPLAVLAPGPRSGGPFGVAAWLASLAALPWSPSGLSAPVLAQPQAVPSDGVSAYPPSAVHPPNARPPYPVPPPPDVYGSRPLVAIYHTDSTEGYLPAMRAAGLKAKVAYTTDQAASVVQVGAILAQRLYTLGVASLHSRAVNDPDGMIGAYENSQHTAQALLSQYPTVRILLDVHRGGPGESAGGGRPSHGRTPAPVVLVVGTDDRLPDPHWRQNLAFAHVLAAAAARLYPSWPFSVVVSPNQYNQELSPGALLVQVGGTGTTLAQADTAARHLARVLAAVVDSGLYPGATSR